MGWALLTLLLFNTANGCFQTAGRKTDEERRHQESEGAAERRHKELKAVMEQRGRSEPPAPR